nr:probable plastid-lipid-associated protein 11, chloroplastic [Ziziphus jujuba var. spinosa]
MSSKLFLSSIQFNRQHHHLNSCSPKPHHSDSSKITCSSLTAQSKFSKQELLNLIFDPDRDLKIQKNPIKRDSIIKAIDTLSALGSDTVNTDTLLLSTWRLLWTTEKE